MYSGSDEITCGSKVRKVIFSSLCKSVLWQLFSSYPDMITELIFLVPFYSTASSLIFDISCVSTKDMCTSSVPLWQSQKYRYALFLAFMQFRTELVSGVVSQRGHTRLLLPPLHPCACCWRQPVEEERARKQPEQVAMPVSLKRERPQLSLSRLKLLSVTWQTFTDALRFWTWLI